MRKFEEVLKVTVKDGAFENIPIQWVKILDLKENEFKNPVNLNTFDLAFDDESKLVGKFKKLSGSEFEVTKPVD